MGVSTRLDLEKKNSQFPDFEKKIPLLFSLTRWTYDQVDYFVLDTLNPRWLHDKMYRHCLNQIKLTLDVC